MFFYDIYFFLKTIAILSLAVVGLAACGGGGSGGSSTDKPSAVWPATGNFEVVQRPSGSSTASPLNASLSLVHASTPDTEYIIDSTAAPANLGLTLTKGEYNSATKQVSGLQNVAYVDDRNGLLRVTSLVSSGKRPATLTLPVTGLCSNSTILANNFSNPFASQLVANTAGKDGVCGTSDDVQVLFNFSDAGQPAYAFAFPAKDNQVLGYLRSALTGQPSHWLVAWSTGQTDLWDIAASYANNQQYVIDTGLGSSTPTFTTVAKLGDLNLYTRNGVLKVVQWNADGKFGHFDASTLTSTSGWKDAGSDGTNAYAFINTGTTCTGTWRILAVSRSAASARTLASGNGSIFNAVTSGGATYASVCSGSTSSFIRIDSATSTQTVLKSSSSMLYIALDLDGALMSFGTSTVGTVDSLNFLDGVGSVLYDAGNSIFYGGDRKAFDMSKHVYTGDGVYVMPKPVLTGAAGYLQRWDSTSKSIRNMGALPSASELGGGVGDTLYVTPPTPSAQIGGIAVARISAGQFQSSGSRLYTIQPSAAIPLTLTTKQLQ